MATNIIKGNTFSSVEDAIFSRIAAVNDKRSQIVVIVPDQFTQSTEVALLTSLSISCSFNIEVMSFSRLAAKLTTSDKPMLNQQTGVMLLAKVIKSVEDSLVIYKNQATKVGFVNNMYAVITALRNSAVSPQRLQSSAISMMTGYMHSKFRDIHRIYDAFLLEIRENYSDISSLLETFIEKIPSIEQIKTTEYFTLDFTSMTKVKRNVLIELSKYAKNVTIGITVGKNAAANSRLFSRDMRQLMYDIDAVSSPKYSNCNETLPPSQQWLLDKLFGYEYSAQEQKSGKYTIAIARSKSEEVEWVASDIKRLIYSGARYKDIAVVVSELDKYASIIRRQFDSYHHAYYIDDKVSLYSQPEIQLLRAAAEVINSGGRVGEWLNYIKMPLSGVSADEAMLMQNYLYKYRINYLTINHMREQEIVDCWSDRYEAIVLALRSDIQLLPRKGTITPADFQTSVMKYFNAARVTENMVELRAKMSEKQRENSIQTMGKLSALMQQTTQMLGDSEYSVRQLYEILFAACTSMNISTTPIFSDNIFIGEMNSSRIDRVKHVYLIGAEADSYPRTASDNGILADKEIKYLEDKNICIEPSLADRIYKGKFELIQLLMRAEQSITVCTPRSMEKSSIFVQQMSKLLEISPIFVTSEILREDTDIRTIARKIGTISRVSTKYSRMIANGDRVFAMQYMAFAEAKAQSKGMSASDNKYKPPMYALGRRNSILDKGYVSVSGVEQYYKCPFLYYGTKVIMLKERSERELPSAMVGKFIHRVMELLLKGVIDGKYPSQTVNKRLVFGGDIMTIATSIVTEVLAEKEFYIMNFVDIKGGYKDRLIIRCVYIIRQTVALIERAELVPTMVEFSFGMDGDRVDAIRLDTPRGELKVRGKIDRIDSAGEYLSIIDYKSSSREFSLKSIYYGKTLQLLIYGIAAKNELNIDLAAVFYLALPFKYDRTSDVVSDADYAYSGFMNDNPEVLRMIDHKWNVESECLLPIKYDNKGNVKASNNLQSKEHLLFMENYAKKLVVRAVDSIDSGYFYPIHVKSECTFCPYSAFCGGYGNDNFQKILKGVRAIPTVKQAKEKAAVNSKANS